MAIKMRDASIIGKKRGRISANVVKFPVQKRREVKFLNKKSKKM
jgi:hypothetical protein